MSTLRFNKWENPDGTEVYKCRAWVNFNGTGTVAIRASGNVSSITDNGVGLYTLNFIVPMSDTYYAVTGFCRNDLDDGAGRALSANATAAKNTTSLAVSTSYTTVYKDVPEVDVAIFR